MYIGFDFFLLFICSILFVQSIQRSYHFQQRIFRRDIDVDFIPISLSSTTTTTTKVLLFFQNEPVPLAPSVVDDLTILASTIYIISIMIVILVFLAWITHYNAPCSSMITSILSTITGLPEPIIRSVALCGACCVWCETTWLFRRIHQFNIWISSRINHLLSVSCKVTYDTICPCCRPPDTPSNRSIIGRLQFYLLLVYFHLWKVHCQLVLLLWLVSLIHLNRHHQQRQRWQVIIQLSFCIWFYHWYSVWLAAEPLPLSQPFNSISVNVDSDRLQTNESLEFKDQSRFVTDRKEKSKKSGKRPRKKNQPKQRSAMTDQSSQSEIQIGDEEEDQDNTAFDWKEKIFLRIVLTCCCGKINQELKT